MDSNPWHILRDQDTSIAIMKQVQCLIILYIIAMDFILLCGYSTIVTATTLHELIQLFVIETQEKKNGTEGKLHRMQYYFLIIEKG